MKSDNHLMNKKAWRKHVRAELKERELSYIRTENGHLGGMGDCLSPV